MPYTLAIGLVWFAVALVIGVGIGVLLRSVAAQRQPAKARAGGEQRAEIDRLRARVVDLEAQLAARVTADVAAVTADVGVVPSGGETTGPVPGDRMVPDRTATDHRAVTDDRSVADGAAVVDDLTVVEGLGPAVAELCHGIGITTWRDLAETEVSLLRTMLDDAGARFQVNDPSSWPQQAGLLAAGRWDEFRDLAESVRNRTSS